MAMIETEEMKGKKEHDMKQEKQSRQVKRCTTLYHVMYDAHPLLLHHVSLLFDIIIPLPIFQTSIRPFFNT